MEIEKATSYGLAASDHEGGWPSEFKAKLKRTSMKILMGQLSVMEKIKLTFRFMQEKKRAAGLDLSDLHARGMTNQAFLDQQLEYIALYSSLDKIVGEERAQKIMLKVMDATAAEALLFNSPTREEILSFGDPFEFFRKYFAIAPETARKAGCHVINISVDNDKEFQFDITWCVWLELAQRMGVPKACLPNCYADDLAYPEYFAQLGLHYSRTGTLAQGQHCCDFRIQKN